MLVSFPSSYTLLLLRDYSEDLFSGPSILLSAGALRPIRTCAQAYREQKMLKFLANVLFVTFYLYATKIS